jgi:hypothetical protein
VAKKKAGARTPSGLELDPPSPVFRGRDLAGLVFGELTVLARAGSRKRNVYWECSCSCGARHVAQAGNLAGGLTTACLPCAMARRSASRTPQERLCVFCGQDDPEKFRDGLASTCNSCLRRATRNGRCPLCKYPLMASLDHTKSECRGFRRKRRELGLETA